MRHTLQLALAIPLLMWGCRSGDPVDAPATCDLEDNYAGNSSRPLASNLLAETQSVTGYLCTGDNDWFSINLASGQSIDIDLSFERSAGDLELRVESIEGAILADSITAGAVESLRYTATTDQTIFVIVSGRESAQNAYDLSLEVTGAACVRDALEPNDSGGEPADLAIGSHPDLTVCFGEDDWYSIPAVDGQIVSAELLFDPNIADLGATLYRRNADGGLVYVAATQETANGSQVVNRVSGEGEFLLHVTRGAQTINADYALELDVTGDACVADASEPNDGYYTPTVLSGDTLIEDATICLGDNDWYQIDVANGQVINADLLFNNSDGDLALRIYELLDDGTISYRAQSATYTDNETITYRPTFAGTYLLWVWPTNGSALGQYDLDVSLLGDECIDDSFEPNNSYLEAEDLTDGTYANMTLCVGDDDWYAFTANNGQVISASIGFEHDDNDLGLAIYKLNDDGTISNRAGSNTLTDDEEVNFLPYEDGDFLARVYRSRGTALATYTMDFAVQGSACVADTQEPNDGYAEAQPLAPGSYPNQTLCVGDADWYEISAGNGQLIDIDVSFLHADNDIGVSLYKVNDDGTLTYRAGSNGLSDNEHILYRPFTDGNFVVYVYRTRGTQVANYGLTVNISGSVCVPDGFEPNNAVPEAIPVADGSYAAQSLCVGDADWYTVDASNGQVIYANISFDHDANDLGMAIYKLNDDGTWSGRSGSNTLTDNETVYYQPYDSGTFLIYVYRTRGTQVATYDFDVAVNGTPCVPDGFESNNTWTETSAITPGTHTGLSLCVGDDDWYEFSAMNGELINAQITFTHADNDLGMRIYERRTDGTIISRAGADSLSDNEFAVYTPYRSGDFLLRVYRSRGTTTAGYDLDLNLSGSGCIPDIFEPNDHWLQATDFTGKLGGPAEPLTMCVSDDDYYDVGTLSTSDVVTATASFTHADNDFGLALYAINPTTGAYVNVRSSDSTTDDETISYTVSSTYNGWEAAIRVYRSRGTVQGTYSLIADIN